jgi:hypothetical protein
MFALVSGMAYREFVDSNGVSWRVWSTLPSAGSRLRGGFDQGWLTFERTGPVSSATASPLKRLVPIPADWETASESHLDLMCRSAEEATRPGHGKEQPAPTESSERA